ncbi:MAG: helix-turn-helix transcriptional regulator [Clostridiales bacterium]|nr:helix-turn-helix transcriptional regulator [Clostridiales bacterium]
MTKKSIGAFLAALRKSRGLTQQEVADRLHVSNKTVSKWEREESTPDISLIPAIAELFDVSCDEILLGKRITTDKSAEGNSAKVAQQIKHLAGKTVTKYQNTAYFSILLSVIGTILLYAVSYAFYIPVMGFSMCLIFIAVSLIMSVIQLNNARHILQGNLACEGEQGILDSSKIAIYRYFFGVLSVNVFAFVLSVPFIILRDYSAMYSVITARSYLSYLPFLIFIGAVVVFCNFYLLRHRLMLEPGEHWIFYGTENGRKMSLIQGTCIVASLLILTIDMTNFSEDAVFNYSAVAFLVLNIFSVVTVVYYLINEGSKAKRAFLILLGSRNFLLEVSAIIALSGMSVSAGFDEFGKIIDSYRYGYKSTNALIAIVFSLITFLFYFHIKQLAVKNIKSNSAE